MRRNPKIESSKLTRRIYANSDQSQNILLRNVLKVYFIIAVFVFNIFYFSSEARINFPLDSPQAEIFEKAKQENKLILLLFYTDKSELKHDFNKNVDTIASRFNKKYEYIKVKKDRLKNEKIISAFRVRYYPTIFLINPKSSEIKRIPPYTNESIFREELRVFMRNN